MTGNLTRDPELRSTPGGSAVCKLRIACNTRRKNGQTGEWEEKPNFFDVTVWGAQGENCSRYLLQGASGGDRWPARGGREWGAGKAKSAKQSISSLIPCSSLAGAMTPAAGAETGGVCAHGDPPVAAVGDEASSRHAPVRLSTARFRVPTVVDPFTTSIAIL